MPLPNLYTCIPDRRMASAIFLDRPADILDDGRALVRFAVLAERPGRISGGSSGWAIFSPLTCGVTPIRVPSGLNCRAGFKPEKAGVGGCQHRPSSASTIIRQASAGSSVTRKSLRSSRLMQWIFFHGSPHPVEQALPIIASDQHHRTRIDFQGLNKGQCFKSLIHRAIATQPGLDQHSSQSSTRSALTHARVALLLALR